MAEDLGKRLLAEVEEVGLDELLHSLRVQNDLVNHEFGITSLDRLIRAITQARPASSNKHAPPPVVEIMSLAPGSGKTHLIYHLCGLAVLPRNFWCKQACAIIIDTDNSFSVQRLAEQMQLVLTKRFKATGQVIGDGLAIDDIISTALRHVHMFRPQSLPSTIATLDALPNYLFNSKRHFSFDREVAFIALDSASAFYWQDRAETENAAFLASTMPSQSGAKIPTAATSGYIVLSASLKAACAIFDCPAIVTTWYLGSTPQGSNPPRTFRPPVPALPSTLRLVVQRQSVRKFPPGISLEQAQCDAPERQKLVEDGRIECFVNEWSVDERTLQALRKMRTGSFELRVLKEGMVITEADD